MVVAIPFLGVVNLRLGDSRENVVVDSVVDSTVDLSTYEGVVLSENGVDFVAAKANEAVVDPAAAAVESAPCLGPLQLTTHSSIVSKLFSFPV